MREKRPIDQLSRYTLERRSAISARKRLGDVRTRGGLVVPRYFAQKKCRSYSFDGRNDSHAIRSCAQRGATSVLTESDRTNAGGEHAKRHALLAGRSRPETAEPKQNVEAVESLTPQSDGSAPRVLGALIHDH